MLIPLKLTLWALFFAPSLAMTQATAKLVKWEDLMVATSKFPRFFGNSGYVHRDGPPKITGLAVQHGDLKFGLGGTPDVEPVGCSSDSGKFTCAYTCTDCRGGPFDESVEAYAEIEEGRFSHSRLLNGLEFTNEFRSWLHHTDGTLSQSFWFTQTLGELMPIDNTMFEMKMYKNASGDIWFGDHQYTVYTGEFDHGSTESTCAKNFARDTAARVAMDQPFWYALNVPTYTLVYTVQDGRLYLAWRLKFDLKSEVDDSFYVWVNARNCSEVIAAASEKMEPFMRTLDDFKKEQRRVFKEQRNIDLEPEDPSI